jgi:uncharacterized protein (DUF983 family)
MPEPNYAGEGPPSFLVFIIGLVVVFILMLLLKSCL